MNGLGRFLFQYLLALVAIPRSSPLEILFTWDSRGQLPLVVPDSADDFLDTSAILHRWARIREETPLNGALLLDCVHTYFPGALSRYSYGVAMEEILEEAGVAAERVTGHDFLMGRKTLEALGRKGPTAMLAGNLVDGKGRSMLPGSRRLRVSDQEVEVHSLLDAEGPESNSLHSMGLTLTDPEAALRTRLRGIPLNDTVLRICLLSGALIEHHPGLPMIPGIRIFAVGMSGGDRPEIREELRNGVQIVYVPRFGQGFGRMRIPSGIGHSGRTTDWQSQYELDSASLGPPGPILEIIRRWSRLYVKENRTLVREMDNPLGKEHLDVEFYHLSKLELFWIFFTHYP